MSMSIHGFDGTTIIQPNERNGKISTSLPNVAHLIQIIAAPILYVV
ncbi:MAG: hypothetical protein QG627_1145 [Chlamydiota bacterium]|nr:hypothetical protein [Chlamydiota bacterium]